MKNKKNLLLISLFICFIIVGCKTDDNLSNYINTVFEDKSMDISLLTSKSVDGLYTGILVKSKEKEKLFENWVSITEQAFLPRVEFVDLTNDSKEELIINLTTGTGTGVNMNNIHILNINTLEEYKVENISKYIEKNLKASTADDNLYIEFNNDIIAINIDEYLDDTITAYEKPIFVNVMRYTIKNNTLYCELPIQVSDTVFAGAIIFEYSYVNDEFKVSKMSAN